MRIALAVFILLHGLIHLLGPAKAFGWVGVSQLRAPIPPAAGLLWLATALLLIAAATGLVLRTPWWWYPALPGVLLSQGLIVTAWGDARFGTLANVIIAVPLLVAALDARPSSFRSRFEHDRNTLLAGATLAAPLVTEADLAPLPPLMQAYLRRMGALGRARVRNLRVTFKAQMRSSPTAPWMQATATQCEFFDRPARLFHMNASRAGMPLDVFHRYVGGAATWSTPISGYRQVDGVRVGTLGDANWIEPSGEWTYGRFEITSIAYNVTP